MDGDRIVLGGRPWFTEIVEHWPRGLRVDGPDAYSVTFHDPDDPEEWVCNCRIPADSADLSPDGLSRIFLEARTRSWRDARGTPWRLQLCEVSMVRGRAKGPGHGGDVLTFRNGNGHETEVVSCALPGRPRNMALKRISPP